MRRTFTNWIARSRISI